MGNAPLQKKDNIPLRDDRAIEMGLSWIVRLARTDALPPETASTARRLSRFGRLRPARYAFVARNSTSARAPTKAATDSSLMAGGLISSPRSAPARFNVPTFGLSLVPLSSRQALIADPRNPPFVTRSDADVLRARISLIGLWIRSRPQLLIQGRRALLRPFLVTARSGRY